MGQVVEWGGIALGTWMNWFVTIPCIVRCRGGCTKVLQVSWRTGQACEDLCWAITDAKEGRASEEAVPLGQGEGQWVLLLV